MRKAVPGRRVGTMARRREAAGAACSDDEGGTRVARRGRHERERARRPPLSIPRVGKHRRRRRARARPNLRRRLQDVLAGLALVARRHPKDAILICIARPRCRARAPAVAHEREPLQLAGRGGWLAGRKAVVGGEGGLGGAPCDRLHDDECRGMYARQGRQGIHTRGRVRSMAPRHHRLLFFQRWGRAAWRSSKGCDGVQLGTRWTVPAAGHCGAGAPRGLRYVHGGRWFSWALTWPALSGAHEAKASRSAACHSGGAGSSLLPGSCVDTGNVLSPGVSCASETGHET